MVFAGNAAIRAVLRLCLSLSLIQPLLPVSAHAADATSAREAAQLAQSSAKGTLIYAYDQAAWHSTDAIMPDLDKLARDGAQGWVIDPAGQDLIVTYYGRFGPELFALARLRMRGSAVVARQMFTPQQREPLSPMAARLVAAKDAALAHSRALARCANAPFNPVVLPPDTPDGPVIVYLLTPQTRTGVYPFGGHYRLEIDVAGTMLSSRPFMTSCFDAPATETTASLGITHVLDPYPTEIHVFLSLWIGKPVAVATMDNESLWQVDGAKITRIEGKPAAAPSLSPT